MQIVDDLRQAIGRWLEGNQVRNVGMLATKSGVSHSSIRRVLNEECKSIDFTNAFAILQVTCSWQETLEIMQKHYPSTIANIRTMSEVMRVTEAIDHDLEQALLDYEAFTIVSLADMPEGTTVDEVVEILGLIGQIRVPELVSRGLLYMEGDRVKVKPFASVNLHYITAQIQHILRFLRHEDIGKGIQHANIHSGGVDKQGQLEIHEIMQRAREEVDRVTAARPGKIPVFTSMIMGSFRSSEVSQ